MWSIFGNQNSSVQNISPDELKEKLERKAAVHLIDVRTEAEYYGPEGSIPGATLMPLDQIKKWADEVAGIQDEVIVYCLSGARSHQAVGILASRGIQAKNMTGGMIAWLTRRFPVQIHS